MPLFSDSDAVTHVAGPAEADGEVLKFSALPSRARFPVKVTVGAWRHGVPGKVKNRRAGDAGNFWSESRPGIGLGLSCC